MNKAKSLKKWSVAAVVFILAMAFILSQAVTAIPFRAFAEEIDEAPEFQATSLNVPNGKFDESSGSFPKTPGNWTGAGVAEASTGSTVAGVMDIDPTSYDIKENEEAYKLSAYPEYITENPVIPFNENKAENTYYIDSAGTNVLLINTNGTETAYGYKSNTFTLNPNKYYQISVYAKTGNFTSGTGATIKLNGLTDSKTEYADEVSFTGINTVSALSTKAVDTDGDSTPDTDIPNLTLTNRYGWQKFTFYIATSSFKTSTVSLDLQVGDKSVSGDNTYYHPANGYAMFDNVEAYEISPFDFSFKTQGNNDKFIKTFNFNQGEYINSGAGSFENGLANWTTPEEGIVGSAMVRTHNANASIRDTVNEYGLTVDPSSPNGKNYEISNNNIAIISSYKKATDAFTETATGIKSEDILISRHKFYKLSAWVKTDRVEGGNGASVIIAGENGILETENKLSVPANNLSGDDSNTARYGWKEQSFYIKGSSFKDYNIHVELWLGSKGNLAKGVAMFDDIKIEEITSTEYTDNSANGTPVSFDAAGVETGVANGNFYNVGNYEEYSYPLPASGWTQLTADTAGTTGFSKTEVEDKDAFSGIMPTDTAHYNLNRDSYKGAINPSPDKGNVFLLASATKTAILARSSDVTVTAGTKNKLSVSLRTQSIDGYGANIVLKKGNNVIATIEKINSPDDFTTFNFYIEGGKTDNTVTVEIWLGLGDRKDNSSKLTSGFVFIKNVSFAALGETESFATFANSYRDLLAINDTTPISFAAYSFDSEKFGAYDYLSDSYVKDSYNWVATAEGKSNADFIKSGIFNYKNFSRYQDEIPHSFRADEDTHGILLLKNSSPAASRLSSINTYNLEASKYYRIDVSVKTDIPQAELDSKKTVGAGISLKNTDFKFENIKNTSHTVDSIVDKEAFKTYTFFVNVGKEAREIGIDLTLGGNEKTNQQISGSLYVKEITVLEINNVEYEDKIKLFDKDDETRIKAVLGETKSDDDNSAVKAQIQWWLIPSILFGVAIIVALVGYAIRRGLQKKATKAVVEKTVSYDRAHTLNKIHNEKETDDSNKTTNVTTYNDTGYSEFDDDKTEIKKAVKPAIDTTSESLPVQDTQKTETLIGSDTEIQADNTEKVSAPAPKLKSEPTRDSYDDEFDD